MADNEYNDEYQFDELDPMETESSEKESGSAGSSPQPSKPRGEGGSNVKRNATIVVVLVFLLMLGYKFFGSFFSGKEKSVEEIPSMPTATEAPTPVQQPVSAVQPLPQESSPPPVQVQNTAPAVQPSADNSQINQKLSSLEASQQNMSSDVSTVNSKLNGINANVNQLNEKIANLSQVLTALTAKLEQQSSEIAVLTERSKPKPVRRLAIRRAPGPMFHIQAIIPGRAWLIATNGSTITVREGTQVPGYGLVKLIDPNQGRVVTSSGQVIRFSQQDS